MRSALKTLALINEERAGREAQQEQPQIGETGIARQEQ